MTGKRLFVLAFTLHVLLGNFCMMPMTQAASMPNMHTNHHEVVMSEAMSYAGCDDCDHVSRLPVERGCSGHCLVMALDDSTAPPNVQSFDTLALAGILPSVTVDIHSNLTILALATAPPNFEPTRTVVLLQ